MTDRCVEIGGHFVVVVFSSSSLELSAGRILWTQGDSWKFTALPGGFFLVSGISLLLSINTVWRWATLEVAVGRLQDEGGRQTETSPVTSVWRMLTRAINWHEQRRGNETASPPFFFFACQTPDKFKRRPTSRRLAAGEEKYFWTPNVSPSIATRSPRPLVFSLEEL